MKTFLAAFSFLILAQPAFADLAVKATIYRIDLNMRLYEVCGAVTATAGESVSGLAVDIQVDSGKYEGHYVATSNAKGNFCQIVRVVGNQISVSLQTVAASGAKPSAVIPVP